MAEMLALLKMSPERTMGDLTREADPGHGVEDQQVGVAGASAVDLPGNMLKSHSQSRFQSKDPSQGRKCRSESKPKPKSDRGFRSHSRSGSKMHLSRPKADLSL